MGSEEAVLEANERFYQAFNLKDAALMDATWAAEHAVTCVHPGWNVLEGRNDVLDSWHSILGNPNQPRIVTGGATATILAKSPWWYAGSSSPVRRSLRPTFSSGSRPSGGCSTTNRGRYTRKDNAGGPS